MENMQYLFVFQFIACLEVSTNLDIANSRQMNKVKRIIE